MAEFGEFREATTHISSGLLRDNDFDSQDWKMFQCFYAYVQLIYPWLFTLLLSTLKHDLMDESAVTKENGLILKTRDYKHSKLNHTTKRVVGSQRTSRKFVEKLLKALRFPQVLFCQPGPVIYKPSGIYDRILAKLVQLEDNGDFDEFDRYSSCVLKHYGKIDCDIAAAVTVEQGLCMIYRNEQKRAKYYAKRGYKLAENTRFPTLFQALALVVMSTLYRNKNKLGASKRFLELAEQCLKSASNYEILAYFYECHGTFLDSFIGTLSQPDKNIKAQALASFKKMGEAASRDSRPRIRDKSKFYALVLSARILLDSNSLFGRQERTVSKNDITLAGQYLGTIKKDLWKSIPRGSQIQFRLVESDLCFRQGKLEEGKELLTQCLHEARTYGFRTETPIIMQRINEIQKIQSQTVPAIEKNLLENDCHETENTSNKESAIEETSDSALEIFTSKYL